MHFEYLLVKIYSIPIPIFVYGTHEFILISLLFKLGLLLCVSSYVCIYLLVTNFSMFNSKLRADNKEVSAMLWWEREFEAVYNPVECKTIKFSFSSFSSCSSLWGNLLLVVLRVTQNNLFVTVKHAKCL